MTLTTENVHGTNLVTVALSGELTAEDVANARADLERVVEEHGSVRILLEYGDSSRVQPRGALEDLKNLDLVKKIDRAALVTDASWLRTAASTAGRLIPFEIKAFPVDEHGAALEWVTA